MPTNGALTQTAAGALGATTYYVRCTWNTPFGEFAAGAETSLAVSANNVLNVAAPTNAPSIADGWNVYVSNTAGGGSGAETKQNATKIALATPWVEPTSGLIAGQSLAVLPTFRYPAWRPESRADFNKALQTITGVATAGTLHMDAKSVTDAINNAVAAMP